MRIHTNLSESEVRSALYEAGLTGVYMDTRKVFASRKRPNGFDVTLFAEPGQDRNGKKRRHKNSGNYGAGYSYAATYDEHGWWMAKLFEKDPEMVLDRYDGAQGFHRMTRYEYV
jgi:hypothetical protein